MATKSTNKTIWTLALVGVLIFLSIKLWPSIKKLFASGGGGSGGAGGVGASGQQPYPQSGSGGGGGGLSFPSGGGTQGSSSFLQNLSNLLYQGTYAGSTPGQQDYIDSFLNQPLMSLDQQGIPLEQPTNYDFGTSGYSYNDPNAPWNSGSDTADYGGTISDYTSGQGADELAASDFTDPGYQNVS